MAKHYRTNVFRGPEMRTSFAHGLFDANERKRDDGSTFSRYECTLIIPKSDTDGLRILQQAIAEVVTNEWGSEGVERFKRGEIKNPILDGAGPEAKDKEGNIRPGLGADVFFIRVSSGRRPQVVTQQITPAAAEDLPSGYWVFPGINAYAWNSAKNGDGVSFGIDAAQISREDDVLGGGAAPVDAKKLFEDLAKPGSGLQGRAEDLFA